MLVCQLYGVSCVLGELAVTESPYNRLFSMGAIDTGNDRPSNSCKSLNWVA